MIRTKQSRLATYARRYRDVDGRADLVERVTTASDESDEIRRTLSVFDWSRSEPDNPSLSNDQVRRLYDAAGQPADALLVLALWPGG
ncbi:hypothetical protein D8Y22_14870 [Salinadaptatus halalkaliphilus]|uniref:Uncharacterized protein n=1 Tax=Salinadaptatus halalkaliphilus TaxID=2419781 RepID=A0A4S3TIV2_9EURY|nr:hypothetical protein [Salinadaptatus halalkaliphilus]THE64004.1 hypothetical protein D8Y22_14870 [Salinadaptatus halalkaliphilus]